MQESPLFTVAGTSLSLRMAWFFPLKTHIPRMIRTCHPPRYSGFVSRHAYTEMCYVKKLSKSFCFLTMRTPLTTNLAPL